MQYLSSLIRTTFALALCVLLTSAASAQEISASHRAAARQLVEVMDLQKVIDESIDVMLKVQLEQNPDVQPFEDIMRAFLSKYMNMEYLADGYVAVYAEAFTEQEIREMTAFYQTETGRKVLALSPMLLNRGAALGQQVVEEHLPELEELIAQRAAELEGEVQGGSVFDVYAPPAGTSLASLVEGRWDWGGAENSCRDNSHQISFSEDGAFMTLSYDKPVEGADGVEKSRFKYEIFEQGTNHIQAAMEGESRRTAEGALVVWDLLLLSANEYCWRQTDWREGSCTAPLVRCD